MALFDGEKLSYFTTQNGLSGNQIRDIQEYKNGSIWFGTDHGVSSYDGKQINNHDLINDIKGLGPSLPNIMSNNLVDDLWFNAGNKKGVYRLSDNKLSYLAFPYQTYDENSDDYVISGKIKSRNGHIWIPTFFSVLGYDGINFTILNDNSITQTHSKNKLHIRSLLEDSKGNLWVGNNGIGVILKSNGKIINFSAEKGLIHAKSKGSGGSSPAGTLEHVFAIEEDSKGNIWFGDRDTGVWKYDGINLINFTTKNGLTHNFAQTIYTDNNGGLWLGLADGSVYLYNGESFEIKFE